MISEELGHNLKDVGIGDLGTAKKVTISKDHTSIIGGAGDQLNIDERCKQIENQIANSTSDYDKEKLQERKSKLQGGTAVIYVGAKTEVKMKEKSISWKMPFTLFVQLSFRLAKKKTLHASM